MRLVAGSSETTKGSILFFFTNVVLLSKKPVNLCKNEHFQGISCGGVAHML